MADQRARQSARDAKKRKAKARTKHAEEYGSWVNRRKAVPKRKPSIMWGAGSALSLADALNHNPDLMDRLFGERP